LLPEAGYRHLAAALALVLGLLPSPGHGATFHYQAFLAGLEVGTAQIEVELDLRRYTVTGRARSRGAMDALSPWRARFEAVGRYGPAAVAGEWFGYRAEEPDRIRQVWVSGGVLREIRDGQRRDDRQAFPGADLLTALFVAPRCPPTRQLHSGRSGYRLSDGAAAGDRCSYRVTDDEGGAYRVRFAFGDRQGLRVPLRIEVEGMLTGQLVLVDRPQ